MGSHDRSKHSRPTVSLKREKLFRRLEELLSTQKPERVAQLKAQLMNVAEQLRAALVASGLSHNELARRSGVEQASISRFIAGTRDLRLESAAKLCELLRMELTKPKRPRKLPDGA